jgi:hypothetical protein
MFAGDNKNKVANSASIKTRPVKTSFKDTAITYFINYQRLIIKWISTV